MQKGVDCDTGVVLDIKRNIIIEGSCSSGKDTTPSVVHFGKSEIVVGEVALMQRRINPSKRTVSSKLVH